MSQSPQLSRYRKSNMERRFLDFPLGYLTVGKKLSDFPSENDPWGLRFILAENWAYRDQELAKSHVGLDFLYEVTRRPDHIDVAQASDIADWDYYENEARIHASRIFHTYLLNLVDKFGRVYFCDAGLILQESNWEDGRPAQWVTVPVEELKNGRLSSWRWGDTLDTLFGSYDLIFEDAKAVQAL